MILKALFQLITGVINLIPFELPQLPDKFNTALDMLLNGITGSFGLINIFIDLRFWLTCAAAMTVVLNIKHLWNMFVWLLNLIPTVNIPFWK